MFSPSRKSYQRRRQNTNILQSGKVLPQFEPAASRIGGNGCRRRPVRMSGHHDKRPANALIAKAVEICEAKGVRYLTYGNFHYGNKGIDRLLEFKIRNGFEAILMPRFYVPLTLKGALCMRLRLHRGLLGILP